MASELKPAYLITGTDLPKVSLALRRLRRRFDEGSVDELDAAAASGQDAVAATNALGLFGGGERLVLVTGIERWKKADIEAVVAYLASPTPGAVLGLFGDASKHQELVAVCTRVGEARSYDIPVRKQRGREQPDHVAWARTQLERAGVRAEQEAVVRLVELVGPDAFALETEVEKLATWSDGSPVGVREVELLTAPTAETSDFAVADAWGARDSAGLLGACESALGRGSDPTVVVARLAAHVARVRGVQRLRDAGVPLGEMAGRLGLRFPPRRELGHAGNYAREELDAVVVRLARLDHALKGGSRLDPELELERALAEAADPAAPRGGGAGSA
ncbi:MAG: hypothetical protein IT201_10545 [Thermoleophilia bacterium]|nr:hypothetical protein [Thermoleophilia bacterium]